MANTVFKLRRSSVAGKQPNTSTLAIGELALNLTDRKLYSSDGTNVWETGANLTTLAVSTNTSVNNVIFSGGIYANNTYGANGQVLTSNGSSIYWSTSSGGGAATVVRQQYTGDGSTTSFNVSGGYDPNTLSVYLNGVLLRNGVEVDVSSGSSFTITPAPANNTLIDAVGYATVYSTTGIIVGNVEILGDHITVGNSSVNTQIYSGNVYLNGSTLVVGNTASNVTINSSSVYVNGSPLGGATNTDAQYVWTNTHTFNANLNVNSALIANGTAGISSQVLTTNGTGIYWSSAGVNTNATYTWSNAHTFNGVVTFAQTAVGTVNNALYLNGTDLSTLQSQITSNASSAYTNAVSYTDGKILTANSAITGNAATAYSNAVGYIDGKILTANAAITGNAATSYSNAVSYTDSVVSNVNSAITANASAAYSNATSYADIKAGTAYSNAVSYTDTKIGTANSAMVANAAAAYSNAVSYVDGKILTANAAITGNAATAYSNSVSYTDGKILTANSAITGNAATAYANAVSYTDGKILTANAAITDNAATAYTNATIFASNASNINSGTIAEARLPFRMNQNVTTTNNVTFGDLTLTGNLYVGSNVNIIGSNNLSIVDNMIYLNANNTVANPDLGFAGNYNDGTYHHAGFFRDASDAGTWKVFDNYLPEPDANTYIDTTNTTFHLANFQANTLNAGNTSTNWFIANTAGAYLSGTVNASSFTVGTAFTANATVVNAVSFYAGATLIGNTTGPYGKTEGSLNVNSALTANNSTNLGGTAASGYQTTAGLSANVATLTANNTSFVGSVSAANVVSNAQLSANLGNYQTTAELSANVATLTANNTSFVGSVSAANVVSNAQLSANLGNYQTTAGLSANVATLTANLANYVVANDGIVSNSSGVFVKAGTGITVNATGVHATVSGVNTAAQYTWTNVQTFNANLVIGTSSQIIANGSFGSNGQVIVSNGTGVYWSNSYTTGIRQNFTGTGACTTFTVSGGYVPQQADVYVNGVKISNTTADVSSGSTIVFSSAPVNGAEIQFVGIQPVLYTFANTSAQYVWTNTQTFSNLVMISSAGISANGSYGTNGQVLTSNGTSVFWSNSATYVRQTFTGTGACTTFQVTGGYTPNNLDVYVTGVKQLSTTDVDISSGNNIVFTIAPVNNAPIEVVGVIPLLYSYANQTYSYTWTNTHTFSNGTATATVNASLISIGNSSVNTQIVAGNVFLNGSTLVIGNTASNISINSTAISVGTVQLNATSFAGTANNASYLGGTAAASYALTSSLSSYQTTAGLNANIASYLPTYTGIVNGSSITVGTVFTANATVVNAVSYYAGTTIIGNTTGPYGKTEASLNVNSALTSNNSSYLGGTAAASYALSSSLSSYQTTAGLSANVATLTANNSSYLGGTAAASYALKTDTHYIGTTAIALNRASASQSLTGITSIDGSAASATNITTTDDTSTSATYYPTFQTATGGTNPLRTSSSKLTFNPSTGTLSATTLTSTSDVNFKKNIASISNALDIISSINGVSFNWKDNNLRSYGVIAQDIEKIIPDIVYNTNNQKTVNYDGIIAFLIEAVKELKNEIELLKSNK